MPGFLIALITTVHIAVCVGLMASILLQSGKGGGLAGTFGAGSSQTLFGGRGAATFLSRATTVLAVTFFVTSLTLGLNASRGAGTRRSLIQEEARRKGGQPQTAVPGGGQVTTPVPAAPGQTPGPAAPQTTGPAPGAGATRTAAPAPATTRPRANTTPAPSSGSEAPAPENPAPSSGTGTE